ncbi:MULTISPECIES: dienelactone hydrolase family protein [Rhodovulum]|uniref:Dienelactone hydrolase n=2 Tax=Rhodovulum TaxID=34008 RepID=A0ABX9DLU2_9RHOB|nr:MULTISPECIES: dienelactone hydrolase family protein [Rhodovulum]PTW52239.1 putative secreted protein [Rhodovulum kholense]RAP43380.1 dienelactone hydrolase [Rhodovulum viride]
MRHLPLAFSLLTAAAAATPLAAENRIDGQAPNAPALAAYGDLPIGVRRIDLVHENQIDIVGIDPAAGASADLPRYDRPLTVEVWYPAVAGATGETSLDVYLRDGITEVALEGRAVRDAAAADSAEPLPLVIMSHGYPGNRFLMAELAENLASKGYVVASIDHTDSTYRSQAAFGSTLVNRTLDQLFVLDEMERLNADANSGLAGLIDTRHTGLIGYSMGGYGAIVTAGGGLSEAAMGWAPANTLAIHEQGSETHAAMADPRIKTAVAIAPWGMNYGLWEAEGLAAIDVPMLFIAGSDDRTAGYETGVRAIWEGATGVDRSLLTLEGGGHHVVAPIPAPEESHALGVADHYIDPLWDQVFTNNIGQHFVTAWLDIELKGDTGKAPYLDLVEKGDDGVWSVNEDGSVNPDHSYWFGFEEGAAAGLRYEVLAAAEDPAPVPLPASVWLIGLACGALGSAGRKRRRAA